MTRSILLAALFTLPLLAPSAARAQEPVGPAGAALRAEWSAEPVPGGRSRVAGYLYNGSMYDGINVWLRVDRLGQGGQVAGSDRRRVVGDVLSGNRLAFDVTVADAPAGYRVVVESVDWVKECR